ncbi:MAG: threonylcarbamoyl-AMP synthase [Hyphomicrobiaceae bacterium]|nr:threonylcarbamoyl-AMP synthase [Hyphomicrobiaceae bacterium]
MPTDITSSGANARNAATVQSGCDDSVVCKAAQLIRDGRLVAFPTETVYGLGADATNGRAVAAIFAAKGRPHFNPLIVHVGDIAAAMRLADLDERALRLAAAFWPGPMTLVARRRANSGLADLVTAGLDTVALRVPAGTVAQALLAAADRPIAAPSANRSGHVSPTRAAHVRDDLAADVDLILDGGDCSHGLESTVIDTTGPALVILRPGSITADMIRSVVGGEVLRSVDDPAAPRSPGQLASHYAPNAPVRLDVSAPRVGEALLAFGDGPSAHSGPMINLSATGDLAEAAANLFSGLRDLDALRPVAIAVMPIPTHGLGEAINDRLRRAAAARP